MGEVKAGLDGVVAGTTGIALVDGQASRLVYRGYSIEDLAGRASYEEVAHLLLRGHLPTENELDEFATRLADEQDSIARGLVEHAAGLGRHGASPMEALRAALGQAALSDPERSDVAARERVCSRLIAITPVLLAAIARGGVPTAFPGTFSWSALAALTGRTVDRDAAAVFDTLLVLHAEHGYNAGTFTARVIASTEADPYAAVIGAIGALSGPLHGGANAAAARMLDEVGGPDRAEAYVDTLFAAKRKVPGIGHRIYRTGDPRARILLGIAEGLAETDATVAARLGTARAVEAAVHARKPELQPNVDFYASVVYTALGIAPALMTPVFAAARMSGWCAHVLEQYAQARLIRPESEYTGPVDLTWVPLEERR